MADPKVPLEKIVKLIQVAKEMHVQAGDLLTEIDALLGGKAGIAEKMRQLTATFDTAWSARYAPGQGSQYVWAFQRDRPAMKRLIGKLGLEEVEHRVANYIASNEDYVLKAHHTFSLFVGTVNRYADAAQRVDPVPDCLHVPACTSDAQHTKRRSAELRAQ